MMRPAILAACRLALRDPRTEESQQHVAACAFCTARTKAVDSLAGFAAQRPEIPAALRDEALLESIYDRVSESAPQATVSDWLEQAPVPASVGEEADWDAARTAGTETAGTESGSKEEAIGAFFRAPAQPDAQVWSGVRRSILADVAHEASSHEASSHEASAHDSHAHESAAKLSSLKLTNWRVLLAGAAAAAAAAVIGLINVSEPAPVDPPIVFADLNRAPDVPFATVRYGSRH